MVAISGDLMARWTPARIGGEIGRGRRVGRHPGDGAAGIIVAVAADTAHRQVLAVL